MNAMTMDSPLSTRRISDDLSRISIDMKKVAEQTAATLAIRNRRWMESMQAGAKTVKDKTGKAVAYGSELMGSLMSRFFGLFRTIFVKLGLVQARPATGAGQSAPAPGAIPEVLEAEGKPENVNKAAAEISAMLGAMGMGLDDANGIALIGNNTDSQSAHERSLLEPLSMTLPGNKQDASVRASLLRIRMGQLAGEIGRLTELRRAQLERHQPVIDAAVSRLGLSGAASLKTLLQVDDAKVRGEIDPTGELFGALERIDRLDAGIAGRRSALSLAAKAGRDAQLLTADDMAQVLQERNLQDAELLAQMQDDADEHESVKLAAAAAIAKSKTHLRVVHAPQDEMAEVAHSIEERRAAREKLERAEAEVHAKEQAAEQLAHSEHVAEQAQQAHLSAVENIGDGLGGHDFGPDLRGADEATNVSTKKVSMGSLGGLR